MVETRGQEMKFKDCIAKDTKTIKYNIQILSRHKKIAKAKRKAERQNRKRGRK